jgi:hypothetical protein
MPEIGQNKGAGIIGLRFHISLPEDEREWEFGQE